MAMHCVVSSKVASAYCLLSAAAVVVQTMIAQGVLSIALFIWLALSSHQPVPMLLPFIALTVAVLVHMPFSVGLHLFSCLSKQVHDLWRRWVEPNAPLLPPSVSQSLYAPMGGGCPA